MEILDMDPGPRDSTLLHLQAEHRSTEVWRLGGGDAQRCRRRNPNQSRLPELHRNMLPLLKSTGFYGIARVSSLQLDWGLISALVERWRPETHSFHLPIGECSITLQDVSILTGLAVDGEPVIGATLSADEAWADIVGSVFNGHIPPKNIFNGARLQLSWFDTFIPKILDDNASDEDLKLYTRSYLLQLIAGSMFTDHSGGLVHCMWVLYIRDLDGCGKYAWGSAVLAFLYRELCKSCKLDRDEVAGCLILLQLWVWERLPSLAPLRTDYSLVDEEFWAGQLAGPLGVRWLVRHSFSEKNGRTLPVYRVILDDIGPSHFIWDPYPDSVLESLPAYCLSGCDIWRYCGPLICIFIVEPHLPNRVLRQFRMFQPIPDDPEYSSDLHRLTLQGNISVNWVQKHQPSIDIWKSRFDYICESDVIVAGSPSEAAEYHNWYIQRTRRFHSRMGALHVYVGELFKSIARRTENLLPEVSELAYLGWHTVQQRSINGFFEALPVEQRRDQEKLARQVAGRRPKRGGHTGGRGGSRSVRRQVDGDAPTDAVVPTSLVEDDYDHGEAVFLGDDNEPVIEGINLGENLGNVEGIVQPSETGHIETDAQRSDATDATVHRSIQQPMDAYPTFNLGLTPGGSLLPSQDPIEVVVQEAVEVAVQEAVAVAVQEAVAVAVQDPVAPVKQPVKNLNQKLMNSIDFCPSFDLGLTPSNDNTACNSSQSTVLPDVMGPKPSPAHPDKFGKFYEPRRSKRVKKSTRCGTDGVKCAKHH